jgi:hypothetical protein
MTGHQTFLRDKTVRFHYLRTALITMNPLKHCCLQLSKVSANWFRPAAWDWHPDSRLAALVAQSQQS